MSDGSLKDILGVEGEEIPLDSEETSGDNVIQLEPFQIEGRRPGVEGPSTMERIATGLQGFTDVMPGGGAFADIVGGGAEALFTDKSFGDAVEDLRRSRDIARDSQDFTTGQILGVGGQVLGGAAAAPAALGSLAARGIPGLAGLAGAGALAAGAESVPAGVERGILEGEDFAGVVEKAGQQIPEAMSLGGAASMALPALGTVAGKVAGAGGRMLRLGAGRAKQNLERIIEPEAVNRARALGLRANEKAQGAVETLGGEEDVLGRIEAVAGRSVDPGEVAELIAARGRAASSELGPGGAIARQSARITPGRMSVLAQRADAMEDTGLRKVREISDPLEQGEAFRQLEVDRALMRAKEPGTLEHSELARQRLEQADTALGPRTAEAVDESTNPARLVPKAADVPEAPTAIPAEGLRVVPGSRFEAGLNQIEEEASRRGLPDLARFVQDYKQVLGDNPEGLSVEVALAQRQRLGDALRSLQKPSSPVVSSDIEQAARRLYGDLTTDVRSALASAPVDLPFAGGFRQDEIGPMSGAMAQNELDVLESLGITPSPEVRSQLMSRQRVPTPPDDPMGTKDLLGRFDTANQTAQEGILLSPVMRAQAGRELRRPPKIGALPSMAAGVAGALGRPGAAIGAMAGRILSKKFDDPRSRALFLQSLEEYANTPTGSRVMEKINKAAEMAGPVGAAAERYRQHQIDGEYRKAVDPDKQPDEKEATIRPGQEDLHRILFEP